MYYNVDVYYLMNSNEFNYIHIPTKELHFYLCIIL